MSTTIDSKVVEMRFDNSHFEKNVSTTMSTLDKLKAKLGFTGATKGLEDVSAAAKKVDLSPIGKSADTVGLRFNAMYTMADQALRNITNSVMNTAENMVKSLTIAPVKDGFSEYEMVLNAVQTTMAATGKTAQEVEQELKKLDVYADKTVYSTADMIKNLPKFTNAGVDLEVATNAMVGIANAVALAGGGASQAASAFYNLGQSIGTGYLTRVDFNSINNVAGMATMQWKEAMVEAAIAAGTLTEAEEGLYTAGGKTFTLQQLFIDGLQERWATSDVILKVLGDYGDETTDIGKKAYSAAQDIKTFSMMMESLKATAGTGWKDTWQTIFGDLDEAKALWTPLTNTISGIITTSADLRNRVLEIALNFAKPWQAITEKLDVVDKVKNVADMLTYYQDVVNRVWRGDFNNRGDDPDRFALLRDANYDYRIVQDLVNKGYEYKLTVDDIEASHKKFGVAMETTSEETEDLTKRFNNLTEAQLEEMGLTEEEIELYQALQKEANRTGISVEELADRMSKNDGRSLLIDSFKNLGSVLLDLVEIVKAAWATIFDPPNASEVAIRIYSITDALARFTESLRLTDKETGELTDNGEKVVRTIMGVFAALDIVLKLIGGPIKIVFKLITGLLKALDIPILDVTASIGDMLVMFNDWIDNALDFSKFFEKIIPPIRNAIDAVRDWIESLKDSKNLPKDIADGILNGLGLAFKFVAEMFGNLWSKLVDGFSGAPTDMISGFANGVWNGIKIVGQVIAELAASILEKFREVLGIHSPSRETYEDGQNFMLGFLNGLKEFATTVWDYIKGFGAKCIDIIKKIDFGNVIKGIIGIGSVIAVTKTADALQNFSAPLGAIGDLIRDLTVPIGKAIKGFANLTNAIAFETRMDGIKTFVISLAILVGALVVLTFLDIGKLWNAVGVITVLTGLLVGVAILMSKLGSTTASVDWKRGINISGMTSGLLSLGLAILLIASTVKLLGSLNPETAKAGFEGLLLIILSMVGVLVACKFLVTEANSAALGNIGKTIFKISLAMLLLVFVAKLIAGMKWADMGKAALGIFGLVGIITILMAATSMVGPNADKIGGTILKVSIALGVLVIIAKVLAQMSWGDMGKAAIGLLGLVGIVAALIAVTRLANGNEVKIGSTILAISAAMLLMAITIDIIGDMDLATLVKGIAVIAVFSVIISALMKSTQKVGAHADKMALTILAIAGAIAILALVATLIGLVDTLQLIKGLIVVGLLSALVYGLIIACRGVRDIKGNLIVLTAAIAVMAGSIILLSQIEPARLAAASASLSMIIGFFALLIKSTSSMKVPNSKKIWPMIGLLGALTGVVLVMGGLLIIMDALNVHNAISNAVGLSLLIVTMAGVLHILSGLDMRKLSSNKIKKVVGVMAALSAVLVMLGLVLAIMSVLNVSNAIPNAVAISVLMVVLAGVLVVISGIRSCSEEAIVALGKLTLIAAGLGLVLAIMSALNTSSAIPNAIAISVLLVTMTAVLGILQFISPTASASIGALGLMLLVVAGIAVILGLMSAFDVAPSISTAISLSILLLAMSAACAIVSYIPAALAINGALGLAAFIGIMAGVVAAAGLLAQIPGFNEILADGGDTLALIGSALGRFVGSIVSGFSSEVMSILPQLGLCLSQFMVNATPFINGLKLVDGNVLLGAGILTAAIIALTVAEFVNGILTFLPCVGSFADLGRQLSAFMINATPFIIGASMLTPEMLSGVKALAETILILSGAGVLEGLASLLGGGSSLENFAHQLPILGRGIVGFAASLGTFTDEQFATIMCAAKAVKSLAQASSEIPNTGGLLAAIVGDNDLSTFASQFPILGSGLRDFLTSVGTFTDDQVATVNCAAEAIKSLASASKEIPNTGGWLGAIVGENDLGTFASQFPVLGSGLADFVTNVGTFTEEQVATVDCAASAIKALASASSEIPNTGGWLGAIVGENDLGNFADQFPVLGTGLANFLSNVGTFSEEQVATVGCAADAIKSLASASSEIPNTGGLLGMIVGNNDLGNFASQFPSVGKGLKSFVSNLGTFTDAQVSTVKAGVSALNAIAKLGAINLGSLNSNLSGFGNKLKDLGKKLGEFCKNMPSKSSATSATDSLDIIISSTKKIADVNSGTFATFADNLKKVSKDAVKKFVDAFNSKAAKSDIESHAKDLGDKAISGAESKVDAMGSVGEAMVDGFAAGITDRTWYAEAKSKAMAMAAIRAAKETLNINSPSKVFRAMGCSVPEGFAMGIDKLGGLVTDSSVTMADNAIDNVSSSIARIANLINTDIDSQPTIRPVLDLSDVRAGTSRLSGMLDMSSSVGVSANIGAITSMMNSRGQNGGNGDVVSAINKLRSELGNISGNTYQINGITYDDGSNISSAIETITREAIRGRRM